LQNVKTGSDDNNSP